jgi:hypothetical protein
MGILSPMTDPSTREIATRAKLDPNLLAILKSVRIGQETKEQRETLDKLFNEVDTALY